MTYPSSCLHGLLVLLGEACEHLGLEAAGECDERQEAEDEQSELPAEVEGHEDGHANVGQGVDDHADLRARGLREREGGERRREVGDLVLFFNAELKFWKLTALPPYLAF